ncbi:MAG: PepSY domain-containing protein [Flavobacteriales bacterium]|nr:PepSY domain-containing protein [Flavobacteriales bacterium]
MKKGYSIRSMLVKLHLWGGLVSGLVIFIVSITGCIYVFEDEFRSILYKDLIFQKEKITGEILPSEIVKNIENRLPGQKLKTIKIRTNAERSIEVVLKTGKRLYYNPVTGNIKKVPEKKWDFLSMVLIMHRSLYLGSVGKKIVAVSAFIFTLMLILGMILWWPLGKRNLKLKFKPFIKGNYFIRIYTMHSVLGFYAFIFLLITGSTGVVYGFKSLNNEIKKYIRKNDLVFTQSISIAGQTEIMKNFDLTWKEALKLNGPYTLAVLTVPKKDESKIKMYLYNGHAVILKNRDSYTFFTDQNLLQKRDYKKSGFLYRMLTSQRDLHTGNYLGGVSKAVAFLFSLIAASLPITGFLMWFRKTKKPVRRS